MESKPHNPTAVQLLYKSWKLLNIKQQLVLLTVFFAQLCTSLIEMAGLNATAIFVAAIIDPDLLQKSKYLEYIPSNIIDISDDNFITKFGIITSIILFLGLTLNYCVQFISEYVGYRIAVSLTKSAVTRTIRAPYKWFLKQNAAEVAQKLFSDGSAIGVAVFPAILELAYALLLVTFAGIMVAFTLNENSILVTCAIAFAALCVIRIIKPLISKHSLRQRENSISCNKAGVELLRGAKEIKIKNREQFYAQGFLIPFQAWGTNRMILNMLQRTSPLILLLVGQLGLITVALVLTNSGLSGGELTMQVAFLGIVVSRLLPAISRASGTVTKLASTLPYIQAYIEYNNQLETEIPKPARLPIPDNWQQLKIQKLNFSYTKDNKILKDVNLTIERNKSYGFLGRSGSGKTTIIDIVTGLHQNYEGEIVLDDQSFANLSKKSWFRKIGYVLQNPFLSDDTLRKNIAIGLDNSQIDDTHIQHCIEAAGLHKTVEDLPDGLETHVGDNGIRLSGGQKQRIAIARALYDRPDILILDEATSALDALTEQSIQDTVNNLKGQVTIIVIAHRLSTLQQCDTLFLMDNGEIIEQGSWTELSQKSALFQDMINMQMSN